MNSMSNGLVGRIYKPLYSVLVAMCLIYHAAILWESRARIYSDFRIFYTGAQIINDGRAKELFNIETQKAYQAKFDIPQREWPLPFNHPPYELLLFSPLGHFSYPIAHAIWSGLNLLLFAIMLQWLLAYVQSPHSFFIAASIVAWLPTMEAFRLGQDSILSTALLLAVFVSLKQERDGLAGLFLALGLYKPQLVLPLAGCLLVARRWHTVIVFTITGIILFMISIWMIGWRGMFDFLSILRSMDRYSYIIYPANMPNIRGLIRDLLHDGDMEYLSFVLTGIFSVMFYLVCVNVWRGECDARNSNFDLKFSVTLLTTILISYHLYLYDLLPVAVALILLFRYMGTERTNQRNLSLVFYAVLMIFFLPALPGYLIRSSAFGWAALPLFLLCAVSISEIWRIRARA